MQRFEQDKRKSSMLYALQQNHGSGQVYESRFPMKAETSKMQYESTWLLEAGTLSFVEARLSHSKADTTGDATYPSCAVCLSRDSIIFMNSQPQQGICKSIKIPKI